MRHRRTSPVTVTASSPVSAIVPRVSATLTGSTDPAINHRVEIEAGKRSGNTVVARPRWWSTRAEFADVAAVLCRINDDGGDDIDIAPRSMLVSHDLGAGAPTATNAEHARALGGEEEPGTATVAIDGRNGRAPRHNVAGEDTGPPHPSEAEAHPTGFRRCTAGWRVVNWFSTQPARPPLDVSPRQSERPAPRMARRGVPVPYSSSLCPCSCSSSPPLYPIQ